jgi:ribosomal protein S17E
MKQVLVIGGYGNFGKRIASALVKNNISVIIAGRDHQKAIALRDELTKTTADTIISVAAFDANKELVEQLIKLKPAIVINTVGPYQTADYSIPKMCLTHGAHYLDLADARQYVANIGSLDAIAKQHQAIAISGASTVPGLSSVVLEHYKDKFKTIESLKYGISPGQKASRGLATTESILTYLGKPLAPTGNNKKIRYGWQDLYRQNYPELGNRWMANCDIPDLTIFPIKYNINEIQFSAGMESSLLHLGMWFTSWLVRIGLPLKLSNHANTLLSFSHYFDFLGTDNGGMHMIISGIDHAGKPLTIKWFLIAKNGDGPQIPCVPAIIMAKKIINDEYNDYGAHTCTGLVTLEECLNELKEFDIKQYQF